MSDSTNNEVDNGAADAVAASAIMVVVILTAIHFIYTGGLSAFIEKIF